MLLVPSQSRELSCQPDALLTNMHISPLSKGCRVTVTLESDLLPILRQGAGQAREDSSSADTDRDN